MLTRTFFARAPLAPGRFAPLPVGAVSAQGATRDRLLALRGGLLSRCASVFPEAGEQSAWFGGPLGGGMHAPELLEAMLLTGAQLGDEELRREALRLCGRVVERQREDGSFGAPGETFAARGRMLRALCAAYSMSGDKQLLSFMLRYMKYLHDTLRVRALSAEDAMHTADTLEAGVAFRAGRVEAVEGGAAVEAVRVGGAALPVQGVFILRAATPPDAVVPGLALENGFVKTDAAMRTNIPGLFAAGDMTGKPLQVANAVGDGLVAALAAVDYLDGVSPMTD